MSDAKSDEPFDLERMLAEWNARPILSTCTTCGGGMHEAEKTTCYACAEAERERRSRLSMALSIADRTVPARYAWCRPGFDTAELEARVRDHSAIAKAKAVALKADRIVFVGPAGIGKTVLAVTTLFAQARAGIDTYFVDAHALSNARVDARLGMTPDTVDGAMSSKFAVIDDIGSEKQLTLSALGEVMHARHAEARPTVITTWMRPGEMIARYGDGFSRRVFEGATVIEMKAKGVGK